MSFLLSKSFLRIDFFGFFGTKYGVRSACGVRHDSAGTLQNNILALKMEKIGQAYGSLNV